MLFHLRMLTDPLMFRRSLLFPFSSLLAPSTFRSGRGRIFTRRTRSQDLWSSRADFPNGLLWHAFAICAAVLVARGARRVAAAAAAAA